MTIVRSFTIFFAMSKYRRFMPLRRRIARRLWQIVFWTRRNQIVKTLAAIFFVALVAATGVTLLEQHINSQFRSVGQGFWWAIVTMTTVGYGDIVPGTTGGRIVAALVMLSGVALVSVFTATVSSLIITNRLKENRGLSKINYRNHIAILGWSPIGARVVSALAEEAIHENRSIVLVNKNDPQVNEHICESYKNLQIKFITGEMTDEVILERANIGYAFSVVILPDESDKNKPASDETTILATLSVKSMNPKVKVIAHILQAANEPHLRRANADQIVLGNKYSGYLLASHVIAPGIPETVDALLEGGGKVGLARMKIPHSLHGKPFSEACSFFKKEYDALLIGFIRQEQGFELVDILSDDYSAIDAFIKSKLESAGKGLAKKSKTDVILNPPADFIVTEDLVAVVIESAQA